MAAFMCQRCCSPIMEERYFSMKYDITTRNFTADTKIRDYVQDKVGNCEKFLPRQVRSLARAEILLEEDTSGREDNRFVCEVIMTVPGAKLVCREGTVNM